MSTATAPPGRRRHPLLAALVAVLAIATLAVGPTRAGAQARLGDVDDPVSASVAISQATFPDGAAGAVVGRADLFPDDLAGASLAGTDRPLLLVPGGEGGTLPAPVAEEIARLVPPDPTCAVGVQIHLLGGTPAVSDGIEQELRAGGWCVDRLAGASRVETSVAIADAVRARPGADLSTVVVARADDWADAATGGAWAAATGTPVVVTGSEALHPAVAAALDRWQVQRIVLLGGTAALSADVEQQASGYAPTVQRVQGAERHATAAAIAAELWGAHDHVLVLNGRDPQAWAWALTSAVPAARQGAPQLYTEADVLPAPTEAAVRQAASATVVGPIRMVSDGVAQQVQAVVGQGPGSPHPPPGGGLVPADTSALRGTDPVAALNTYLVQAGLPAVAGFDPELQAGAVAHSAYMVAEQHPVHGPYEDPTSPWSTPSSRGEGLSYGEAITTGTGPPDPVAALNAWMTGPYHAGLVTAPNGTRYGIGDHDDPAQPGFRSASTFRVVGHDIADDGPYVLGTYPADGRTLVSAAYNGRERPDPLAGCPGYAAPTGAPVYVAVRSDAPQGIESALTGPAGPVEHCRVVSGRQISLMPRDPWPAGTEYTATVVADGVTTTWRFITAADQVSRPDGPFDPFGKVMR